MSKWFNLRHAQEYLSILTNDPTPFIISVLGKLYHNVLPSDSGEFGAGIPQFLFYRADANEDRDGLMFYLSGYLF